MNYCLLTDRLPTTIDGIKVDTRTSTALACVIALNERLTEDTQIALMADALFGQPLEVVAKRAGVTPQEMCDAIGQYLEGAPKEQSGGGKGVKDFDFVQDDERILSAYRQVYGVSLDEVCNMHWWEFLALFKCLPMEGNTFGAVRDIRTRKPKPSDTAEQRAELSKAKKAVALKDNRTKAEKAKDFQDALNAIDL